MKSLRLPLAQRPPLISYFVHWIGIFLIVSQMCVALIVHVLDDVGNRTCENELHYVLFVLIPPIALIAHALFLRYLEKSISRTNAMHGCVYGALLSLFCLVFTTTGSIQSWKCSSNQVRVVFVYTLVIISLWLVAWCGSFYFSFLRSMDDDIKRDLLGMVRCNCFSIFSKKIALMCPYIISGLYSVVVLPQYW